MPSLLLAALLGTCTWTLLEYTLHRGAGHHMRRGRFRRDHARHHAEVSWFASTAAKATGMLLIGLITFPLAALIAGPAPGTTFATTLMLTYAGYEWLHRRAHTHPPRNRYGHWVRRHHFWHHFGDTTHNHGVTTPIWDIIFRTYTRPTTIRVPPKRAMPWLCDPATGTIRPAYRDTYTLRTPRDPQRTVTASGSDQPGSGA